MSHDIRSYFHFQAQKTSTECESDEKRTAVKRKAKVAVISSDESDAEDPLPSTLVKCIKKQNGQPSRATTGQRQPSKNRKSDDGPSTTSTLVKPIRKQNGQPSNATTRQRQPSKNRKSDDGPSTTSTLVKPIRKQNGQPSHATTRQRQPSTNRKSDDGPSTTSTLVKPIRKQNGQPSHATTRQRQPSTNRKSDDGPSTTSTLVKPIRKQNGQPSHATTRQRQPSTNRKSDEGPSTTISYLGVEKPAKEIEVSDELLAALDTAHTQIRTPSVRGTPEKSKTVDAIAPSPLRRSARKSNIDAEKLGADTVANSSIRKSSSSRTPSKTPKKLSQVTRIREVSVTPKKQQQREEKRTVSSVPVSVEPASSVATLQWTEKYRPTKMNQILGQKGDKSCMHKLYNWLRDWSQVHGADSKGGTGKSLGGDGSRFKAALLSGPPGIGKTTTAQVVCKELDFNYVEMNASDTRNKRNLEQMASECLSSHSMVEYNKMGNKSQTAINSRTVLIMDEVDGMSGNEDRAGISELITLIKKTRVPIICICNDRYSQKIRSLANHCYDLRFHRPQVQNVLSAMMSLLFKEHLKLAAPVVKQIIESAHGDIRQVVNHLNFLAGNEKNLNLDDAKVATSSAKKDETVNVFDAARKLFSGHDDQALTLNQRTELFFADYDLIPLFVQENYLNVSPSDAKTKIDQLERISQSADLLSWGDVIDRRIRTEQNWSLLHQKAMFSTVLPTELMNGRFHGQIRFPLWFGKFQKHNRLRRVSQQLQFHTASKASASPATWITDYAPALRMRISKPMLDPKAESGITVKAVLRMLDEYALTLEDKEAIMEITSWPGNEMEKIPSKMERALTIGYKKHLHKLPYAVIGIEKSKKRGKKKENDGSNDSENEEEREDDADVDMIEVF